MILQELCDLYDRLAADPSHANEIARPGWSREKVAWALVIDESGTVLGLYPVLQGEKQKYQELMVPEHDGRTVGIKPFFLCDKGSYLLGIGDKRAQKCHDASRELHESVLQDCDDAGARAALALFNNKDAAESLTQAEVDALSLGGMVMLCLSQPGKPIYERDAVKEAWRLYRESNANDTSVDGWCSVTGRRESLARLFPQVTGVPGAQSSGASLVSYNFDAATSYGKDQAYNASISEEAAFKSGYALKYLLGDKHHRVYQGNTAVVFWTDTPIPLGNDFLLLISGGPVAEDKEVRDGLEQTLKEMRLGRPLSQIDAKAGYCLLGLSPNAARLSVRFFERGTFGSLANRYGWYLRDTEIVGEKGLSLWQLLAQTAPMGKLDNIPSTLVTRCFEAMMSGGEFPKALSELVRSRMRADHGMVTSGGKSYDCMGRRAAVLKACYVRHMRLQGVEPSEKEGIEVALNRENTNMGYLLGRLFAVLERAQQGAISSANATIRDRYIGAASTTPARVFQPLLRGCQAHLSALRKDPSKAWLANKLERELDDIIGRRLPDTGIPKVLSADDQDMFFVGYYQERCDLWVSKAERDAANETASDDNKTKED